MQRVPLSYHHANQAGFTLLQVTIIMAIASIIMVSMLPGDDAGDPNRKTIVTIQRLQRVEQAMYEYMKINGRRPCPADGQYAISNANFGVEAANPGSCTGGTPATPMGPDAGTGKIIAGVVPTKTLNLPDQYAFDEWGRRYTYVVDKRATEQGSCYKLQNVPANNGVGGVYVQDATSNNTTLDKVMVAYISHGADGHGGFPMEGSTVANRFNTGSTDTDTLTNAGVNSSFTYSTAIFSNIKVKKDRTATFDDLVYNRPDTKNTCCVGSACTPPPPPPGFVITDSPYSGFGLLALAIGDINGDGIADILTSDYGPSVNRGRVYVIYGTKDGFPNPFDVTTLNGNNGFTIDGASDNDWVGNAITVADVNGDSIGDIIIGASAVSAANHSYNGAVYVVYGTRAARLANYNLANGGLLIDGAHGFRITGNSDNEGLGRVAGAGDIDGDGKADIIFSGEGNLGPARCGFPALEEGYTYVVFGDSSLQQTQTITAAIGGGKGFRLDGKVGAFCPISDDEVLSIATGDIDGDGKVDILLGQGNNNTATVVFGHVRPWSDAVLTTVTESGPGSFLDGTNGFKVRVDDAPQAGYWGYPVALGDFNGDGKSDMIVGGMFITATGASNYSGVVDLIFGHAKPWNDYQTFNSIFDGIQAARVYGLVGAFFGFGVAAGDYNGDAKADFITGEINDGYWVDGQVQAGSAYVVFGKAGNWSPKKRAARPEAGQFCDGTTQCFRLDGKGQGDCAGIQLAIGDVNGDGKNDLAIAAPHVNCYNSDGKSGEVYIYWGKAAGWTTPVHLGDLLP